MARKIVAGKRYKGGRQHPPYTPPKTMTNIMERLRTPPPAAIDKANLMRQAADRIEELEADVEGMCSAVATFDRLVERVVELENLLKEARTDLAEYVSLEHPYRKDYPDEMRRYNRDMDLCYRIDAAIGGETDD